MAMTEMNYPLSGGGTPSYATTTFTSTNGTVSVPIPASISDASKIKAVAFFNEYTANYQYSVFAYIGSDGTITNIAGWNLALQTIGLQSIDRVNKTFSFLWNESGRPFNCIIYYED
jgi:hypothetical protein